MADDRWIPFSLAAIVLCTWFCAAASGKPAAKEILHFTFEDVTGDTIPDVSGNGHNGANHGGQIVARGLGHCLMLDGKSAFVDTAAFDVPASAPVSISAWVYLDALPASEPAIAGFGMRGFELTYYHDNNCYWYRDALSHCSTNLSRWAWHNVIGTVDGETSRLFIDGKCVQVTHESEQAPASAPGKRFGVGALVPDSPGAASAFLHGMIDEVVVWRGALSDADVAELFKSVAAKIGAIDFRPVMDATTVRNQNLSLAVADDGLVQVNGAQPFQIRGAYSYRGTDGIQWHHLGEPDGSWRPKVSRESENKIRIEAENASFRVARTVSIDEHRVLFTEQIENRGEAPVGLIFTSSVASPRPFDSTESVASAENPAIFAAASDNSIGILAEDDVSRLRFEPVTGVPLNRVGFRVEKLALYPGRPLRLQWSLYVLPKGSGYFDLVNAVRRDWKVNFRIDGPASFFDINSHADLLDHPDRLAEFLKQSGIRVAILSPWLDYDPGDCDHIWTRAEYKAAAQRTMAAFRKAAPEVKVLGAIETDWVNLDRATLPNADLLPVQKGNASQDVILTPEQAKAVEGLQSPWHDSLKRDSQGRLSIELYTRGGAHFTSLSVYPAPGNHQHQFLLDQASFLLDDVCLDGFYIDEFSQGYSPDHYMTGNDGISGDVDPDTGALRTPLLDYSLAGIGSRVALCRAALDRGKVMIANTYSTSRGEQSLSVWRFAETSWSVTVTNAANPIPPLNDQIIRGVLGSPIGLGPQTCDGNPQTLMKYVIAHLRHGVLFYHYALDAKLLNVPDGGGYALVRAMYPITPQRLGHGWIEGRERIITAVSHSFIRSGPSRPVIRLFDSEGREITTSSSTLLERRDNQWHVQVRLKDWTQVAVIE